MSDYLIGDIQGCYSALQALLKKLHFSWDKDQLFFLGDVVNRGDKSLATLRFIKNNSDNASMLLGNHDFHLLACAFGHIKPSKKDTFIDIINAHDADQLLEFLAFQPLFIQHQDALMVHAGIPPNWDIDTLTTQAKQVQAHLQSDNLSDFLKKMYHDNPHTWHPDLTELDQCQYTINALMRMRFCKANGELEFAHKLNVDQAPQGFKAWFEHDNRLLKQADIFFGHWSTLSAVNQVHIYPMDHGCIWGGKLSAIRLEDKKIFSIAC